MGIGPTALKLYEKLEGQFRGSICELGSQEFVPDTYVGPLRPLSDWEKGARGLYAALGIPDYVCVDINGERGAVRLDLNEVDDFGYEFDIVTNHGTTEHILNQACCFRFVHNSTKVGGLMIHIVPTRGYASHGFFLYDQLLFNEMAKVNQYAILHLYNEDDQYGTLLVVVMRKDAQAPFLMPMLT